MQIEFVQDSGYFRSKSVKRCVCLTRKAKELERSQFLNYAKGIANSFEIDRLCLTDEGWAKYHRREARRNRAKRMRDARQERSIARLERMGKIQRLIDRIMISQPGYALCPENRQAGVLMLKPAAEPPIIPKI